MKGGFVLGFIFILFGLFLVSASTCNDNQTIMRLYSSSNSHVSFWNESTSSYLEEICYDVIFGQEYNGSEPHKCTGTNRILSLYASSNSHASEVSDPNYDHDVCYGNLVCNYDVSSGDSCSNSGERVVARMFSDSNSHVSNAGDSNYPIKICCGSSVPSVSGVYWADMNGNEISEADFGDTVELVARGRSTGSFDVYEDDSLSPDDEIRVGSSAISGVADGPDLIGVWTIKSKDLDKTLDFDGFYFSIGGEESEHLKINRNANNFPMTFSVVSPVCGEYYNESGHFNIDVSVNDPDDIITGVVSIDGEVLSNFSNDGFSSTETFDKVGTSQIIVGIRNNRGETRRSISNIMVLDKDASGNYVDGDYVAACISKPKDASYIPGTSVEFDASSTRGVRITGGVLDELIPGEDSFSWHWRFFGPGGLSDEYPSYDSVNSVEELAYRFTKEFPVPGHNSASLRVEV